MNVERGQHSTCRRRHSPPIAGYLSFRTILTITARQTEPWSQSGRLSVFAQQIGINSYCSKSMFLYYAKPKTLFTSVVVDLAVKRVRWHNCGISVTCYQLIFMIWVFLYCGKSNCVRKIHFDVKCTKFPLCWQTWSMNNKERPPRPLCRGWIEGCSAKLPDRWTFLSWNTWSSLIHTSWIKVAILTIEMQLFCFFDFLQL